ncbi:2-succinyl-5-enolpyruvyl-6-hydroxy-3-cyclohexene-1-carboxylic-acid synthase [Adhaeribacter aquaticus]|uniref:2-succinyl-5-enolpyruvyl-6-hydroxy-3- cyclohexene-1-carboxylic-acid synthase n=1 Tax=Adhaeribacter aquaticus TaxID=299567 RepID=UPI0003FE0449|nr:2-succinyl-5-enolpyruvyl-6-hydroxy-3-cyclohexene-1-carboxylic-acid synthase [Adhaeribacter aquaticus]
MNNLQPVHNIAQICAQKGVTNVVLSPGSRCAPLTIAFARHPKTKVRTVPDERAAAFIGLGLAQVSQKASVLVCTSGTAAYNYAPAIAEAFFQQVPLLVITADRPPEWVDQLDGQTIRQQNIYGKHIKRSFDFPVDLGHPDAQWFATRMISEAINEAHTYPAGPVHINVPLREPFYPAPGQEIVFDENIKIIEDLPNSFPLDGSLIPQLEKELTTAKRIVVVAGQQPYNEELLTALDAFKHKYPVTIIGDLITNTHTLPGLIRHQDVFLSPKDENLAKRLTPDLLITFGLSILSKNLKLFLRHNKPKAHWHIQPAGDVADTFQALTRIIRVKPLQFFKELAHSTTQVDTHTSYQQDWQNLEDQANNYLTQFLKTGESFNEFKAFKAVFNYLPDNTLLHLANSMAVRYGNIISLPATRNIEIFANRGTSGIDGSTSTAIGTALQTENLVTLVTGDMAFFYDRNALWHNYLPSHFRIIIFNNHGGGIFRMIEGPRNQPELEEYFETYQPLDAANTANDFKLKYFKATNYMELKEILPEFYKSETGAAILEIFTNSKENAEFFQQFRLQKNITLSES